MDPARFARVRALFEEALDRAPAERAAWLAGACAGDAALESEVVRLLAAHDAEDRVGSTPPPETRELLAALAGSPPLAAGSRCGTWRLLRPLGSGGMGEVWEAEQEQPRRRAALKLLRAGPAGTRARLRFRDEIDALARLDHPGIARILEAGGGSDGERLWYAMELVPGARPITEAARGRPWRERVELLCAVCDAVEHGHRNGVIHRDLKPSNILLGEEGRPRVIDFGVARVRGSDLGAEGRTQAGEVVGTLSSMAPEQLDGHADVRSDVYALGLVLHELLTGQPALDLSKAGMSEAMHLVREAVPAPPRASAPELPIELDWITRCALEKDPELRYPRAGALADDLRRLLADEPVEAGAPTATHRLRGFLRRHRVAVALGTLFLVLIVGGSVGTLTGMLRAQRKEQEALAAQFAAEQSAIEASAAAAEAAAVAWFIADTLDRADPELDGSEVRVVDALDAAEANVAAFLSEHPRAEATLRTVLGQVDRQLGRKIRAEAQLRRALELIEARGPSDADDLEEALRLRVSLGLALLDLHRVDEAEQELAAVVDVRRAAGEPGEELASALGALAAAHHRQSRFDEAEAEYREALEREVAARGESSVEGARIRSSFAGLMLELERVAEAESLLVPALATLRQALAPDHVVAITALNQLAGVRYRQQRLAEASELLEEALELRSRRLPPGHPILLASRANLATLKLGLGEHDEAAAILEEVVAARLERDPPWHPELVVMTCNLASMVKPRGDDAVRAVVRRLVEAGIGERAESLRSAVPLPNLARFLLGWGLAPEALSILDEAAAASSRLQPTETIESLIIDGLRCRALAEAGRGDHARDELESMRLRTDLATAPDDPGRAILDLDQALAWRRLGDLARAEDLLLEAVPLLERLPPAEPLRLALAELAACCDATGRSEEAGRWRARLAALPIGGASR